MEEFGLSAIRASEWLREFREDYPDWTHWDAKRKCYEPTQKAYTAAEGGRSLQLDQLAPMLEPYLHEAVPQERPRAWAFGRPSPRAFSRLCLAISDQLRIEFLYSSMGNPQPHLRTVEPHSIVQTARRWHVRGFCVEKGDFRDFVLGRMSQIRLLAEGQQMDSREDVAWKTEVEIHIVAHPLLSLEQQGVVRQEYFRGTSARIELCRAAVLPYFLDDIAAATDISTQKPPEFQLAVDNVEDCRPWLFPK